MILCSNIQMGTVCDVLNELFLNLLLLLWTYRNQFSPGKFWKDVKSCLLKVGAVTLVLKCFVGYKIERLIWKNALGFVLLCLELIPNSLSVWEHPAVGTEAAPGPEVEGSQHYVPDPELGIWMSCSVAQVGRWCQMTAVSVTHKLLTNQRAENVTEMSETKHLRSSEWLIKWRQQTKQFGGAKLLSKHINSSKRNQTDARRERLLCLCLGLIGFWDCVLNWTL